MRPDNFLGEFLVRVVKGFQFQIRTSPVFLAHPHVHSSHKPFACLGVTRASMASRLLLSIQGEFQT